MSDMDVAFPSRAHLRLVPPRRRPVVTRRRCEVRTTGMITIPTPAGDVHVEAHLRTVVHPDDTWELTIHRHGCPHVLTFRGDHRSPTPAFLRDVFSALEADC